MCQDYLPAEKRSFFVSAHDQTDTGAIHEINFMKIKDDMKCSLLVIFIVNNMACTFTSMMIPVSYTHLDVYKRQEFIPLIESCSSAPFLELFARGNREGWDMWGNQATEDYEPCLLYTSLFIMRRLAVAIGNYRKTPLYIFRYFW